MVTMAMVNNIQLAYGVVVMILVIACQTCYRIKTDKGSTPGRNARHFFFILMSVLFLTLGYATMAWYIPTMYLIGGAIIAHTKNVMEMA